MRKLVYVSVLFLLAVTSLTAVPGMSLHYAGSQQITSYYTCYALQEDTNDLRFYHLYDSGNGFGLDSFYLTLSCSLSSPQTIYEYQHPLPLPQDGGYPELILAEDFMGKVFFLLKNDLHFFVTVVDEFHQINTFVTNNPNVDFDDNPYTNTPICILSPELIAFSYEGSVYLINLQSQSCYSYWNFPNSLGSITFNRFSDTQVMISSYLGYQEHTSYLFNFQAMTMNHVYYGDWATEPISTDFGNGTYLATQTQFDFDWVNLVRTLLITVDPDNTVNFFPLYYGGSTDAFNYTPMHTFEYVNDLGGNRFLAICTDYNMIPENRRLGIFQISGNNIVYDDSFSELSEQNNPMRLYRIQPGYFLSYFHYQPAAAMARLLDTEAETISLPDSNVITGSIDLLSTGQNAFYAVTSGNKVHVYTLVEPTSAGDETQAPPVDISLSAWPNPFRNKVTIEALAAKPGDLNVSVYDIRGRLIRDLGTIKADNGAAELEWDGKDLYGARPGSGVYLIRIAKEDRSAVQKVVLLD